MTEEIQELLAKRYGGTIPCERLRAQKVVQEIVEIMHPKFTPEAEAEGDEDDGEGYIADYEWDADTTEAISTALNRHGFGPDSCIKYELDIFLSLSLTDGDDGEEEEDDDDDGDAEGGEVPGLTDGDRSCLESWADSARDYSMAVPGETKSTAYWTNILGKIGLNILTLEDAGELLEWSEAFTEVEADDNVEDDGPHSIAAKKLDLLIQAKAARDSEGNEG